MECDWKIGDRIVCIDDHNTSMDEQEIAEGCIYTIRWIGCDGFSGRAWGKHQSVDVCVRLVGVVRRGIDNPFAWTRFRPVRTIDTTATVAALAQAMREAMKKGMVDA